MSRNLGDTYCAICHSEDIVLEEAPRPIRREECGPYVHYVDELTVANAHCGECDAKYLAWVRHVVPDSIVGAFVRDPGSCGFVDLSFRASFNDEPAASDLPTPEKLAEIFRRDCRASARRLRDEAARLIEQATLDEHEAETGVSVWEAYRR